MQTAYISLVLIIVNIIVSYKGFTNTAFYEGYLFDVEKILVYKDYKRLITSGFLHINWLHLILNMFSLYFFSGAVEIVLGSQGFLLIYFAGLIGGNLLALFMHRHHPDYTAVGASGAVCAIMFAGIAIFPGMNIGLFFLPISVPAWLFGLAFVLYCIYGIKTRNSNVGHDAHLGGALVGVIAAVIIEPAALSQNYITILLITVPCIIFLYLAVKQPHLLLVDKPFTRKKIQQQFYSVDHQYNAEKINRQKELDALLEKIHRKGIDSLSKAEREKLEAYSKR